MEKKRYVHARCMYKTHGHKKVSKRLLCTFAGVPPVEACSTQLCENVVHAQIHKGRLLFV